MDNIVDKINNEILQEKETLSVLPQNNKKNIEAYVTVIEETRNKYRELRKQIAQEIKKRYHRIIRKKVKPEVAKLEEEIKAYDKLYLLDETTRAFEKMGLDVIYYNLSHFYKNDLSLINEYILDGIKAFQKCNIKLTANDFKYSQYTFKYMSVFFEELAKGTMNSDTIKSVFEEIFWKCPDIIKYINLNIYYLYFKYEKDIDKYLKNEKRKFIDSFKMKPDEIIKKYESLKEEYYKKYNQDESVILNKFVYQGADINLYEKEVIKKEYSKFIKEDIGNLEKQELENLNDNLYKFANTLYEYQNYLKYVVILDDMKKRNTTATKTEYFIDKDIKKIALEEEKLMKLNAKIEKASSGKTGLFSKDYKVDELIEKSDAQLKELKELYETLEDNILNSGIKKLFAENATIYQLLSFISCHYSYFSRCLIKNKIIDETEKIDKSRISELKEFLLNPQFNVLIKNVKINEDRKIEKIIKDRYYLFNLDIKLDDLKPENLEEIAESVNKIAEYNNIEKSKLTVKDIKFMCKLKNITER